MTKRHLVIRTGQSNEGDGNLVTLAAVAVTVPTKIGQIFAGKAMFGYCMQDLENKGYCAQFVSRAVGSTGWKTQWAGNTAGYGSVGYDPNGYIAGVVSLAQSASKYYDDVTILMSNGQQDSLESTSLANYRDSIIAIVDRYLATTNAKILVGLSCGGTNDANQGTNYETKFEPAITAVIANYATSAPTRVLLGVNWYRVAGRNSCSLSTDGIHAADACGRVGGMAWSRRLRDIWSLS